MKRKRHDYTPICTGAAEHFVDAEHVEGVAAHTKVESVLAAVLDHVLVAANATSFQGLGRDLFTLVRDQVSAEGEVLDASPLAAKIENANLGVCVGGKMVVLSKGNKRVNRHGADITHTHTQDSTTKEIQMKKEKTMNCP